MRAIGASRWTVVWLILAETLMLGAVAGVVGAAGAVGMLALLGTVGIPAPADVVVLLFAGPRLYPTVGAWHVGFGLLVVLVVALVAALYPAALASRVAPVVAMQGKE
jgi:ABC-type antimicrobial peptide transport system permease subunit